MKGKKVLLPLAAFGLLMGVVACGGGSKTSESKSEQSQQSSTQESSSKESSEQSQSSSEQITGQIVISSPDNVKKIVGVGQTLQLSAAVGEQAIQGVTWSSDKETVATVDQNGLVTAVGKGSATITAKKDGCTDGTFKVSVELEKITVTAANDQKKLVGIGQMVQLSADKEGVTWTSDKPEVAIVGESTGLVISAGKGTAKITASKEGYTEGSIQITVELVKINVSLPENEDANLLVGEHVQLTADMTGVTWSSDKPDVATVNISTGLVIAAKLGTAVISASKDGFDAGSVEIKVVRPDPTAILDLQYADHYAADGEWSSSGRGPIDTPVYEKDNARGGICLAYFGDNDKETLTFSSDKAVKAELVLMIGYYYSIDDASQSFTAKFNNADITIPANQPYESEGTSSYTYKELSLGEVDIINGNNVLELTMKEGAQYHPYLDDVEVYAASAATIAVVQAAAKPDVTIDQESITVKEGKTANITSSLTGLTYKSNSTSIATVDENGVVSGVKVGETTIAISKDGYKTIRVPVTVTEAEGVIAVSINAGTSENDAVTFRTSQNLSEPYNYIVDAWPENAVATFSVNNEGAAGAFNMYMRCRASGGYNSSTTDDLATCMEVKVNGTAVAISGTVSGNSFTDYLLGEVNLNAGVNTITIKCLTTMPTANLLRFIPKA